MSTIMCKYPRLVLLCLSHWLYTHKPRQLHLHRFYFFFSMISTQWAKSPKEQSEGVRFFVNSALKIQRHIVKKDCFFSDFAHWEVFYKSNN